MLYYIEGKFGRSWARIGGYYTSKIDAEDKIAQFIEAGRREYRIKRKED